VLIHLHQTTDWFTWTAAVRALHPFLSPSASDRLAPLNLLATTSTKRQLAV